MMGEEKKRMRVRGSEELYFKVEIVEKGHEA